MLFASTANLGAMVTNPSQPTHDGSTINAEVHDHPAGVTVALHSHAGGQLSIVRQGTMNVWNERGWWLVPPGLAIWIPAGTAHGANYSASSTLINVRVPDNGWPEAPEDCSPVVATDLIQQLAMEATRLCRLEMLPYLGTRDRQTLRLIGDLLSLQLRQPTGAHDLFVPHGHDRRLRTVISLLRRNPAATFTLDELASMANTSVRTLARLFLTETGMTFSRWRDHLRVVTAVDLLARGAPIARVALELGYASAPSFTTLFTRILGAPPRRYMRLWQKTTRRFDEKS